MTLTRKDLAATVLTALVVLVYLATHEGWNVWLVGGSHRWAAGAILLLGGAACAMGTPSESPSRTLMLLGIAALVLAVIAIVTASLTPLSLLVLDIALLWAVSTTRHSLHATSPRAIPH